MEHSTYLTMKTIVPYVTNCTRMCKEFHKLNDPL